MLQSFKKSLFESNIIDVPIKKKVQQKEESDKIRPHHVFFGPIRNHYKDYGISNLLPNKIKMLSQWLIMGFTWLVVQRMDQ